MCVPLCVCVCELVCSGSECTFVASALHEMLYQTSATDVMSQQLEKGESDSFSLRSVCTSIPLAQSRRARIDIGERSRHLLMLHHTPHSGHSFPYPEIISPTHFCFSSRAKP